MRKSTQKNTDRKHQTQFLSKIDFFFLRIRPVKKLKKTNKSRYESTETMGLDLRERDRIDLSDRTTESSEKTTAS